MNGTEKWWQSRAIWGGLAVVGAVLGKFIGYDIDTDATLQPAFVDWVLSGVAFVGGALAIWGRIKATKKIS